jgi:hypothetical protein
MNEARAREVLMLQAFETVQPTGPCWTDEDRAWATRLALQDGAADSAEAFIVRRAHHAMQRLLPREPTAAKWHARRLWKGRWVVWAVLAGALLGVLADSIGSGQRINLLAPPLWAVLAWNLVVYGLLLGHALAHLLMRPTRPGGLVRLTQRLLRIGRGLPGAADSSAGSSDNSAGKPASGSSAALQAFAALWLRCSAALSAARAATLLHAASAALALGLIGGLYLRGLVLDYRAAWESTFLSADMAHGLLAVLLAPAVALSGIALPDGTAFEALRAAHGSTAVGVPAAPWIHLFALTLLLFVVLPRSVLALAGAMRSRWLASHLPLPLTDAYFQRLTRQQQGAVAQVTVVPYAATPGAQAALGLRAVLAPVLGDGLQIQIAATVAFGTEDDPRARLTLPAGSTLVVALFDLAATPEAENQGRFAQQLAARAPAGAGAVLMVDEAAFRQRFGGDSTRLAQRREAWRAFAETLGTLPVFADLTAPDLVAAPQALQRAMASPLRGSSA